MLRPGAESRNTAVVIDGNSLINRAYYAMQRPMITKEGLYTQGVYGFLNMLNKIIKDYGPTHIAVAFDLKAPTFRHLEYGEYKAGRKKMPPELAMQIPLLKEVLEAMNIAILELEGYEADDILGTVAARAEEEGLSPLIITGDKDALQLASNTTNVLITKKGISEFELFDHDKMLEVYGLTPQQFIDYKGLRGDTSDNIPGIPGVGEKTALKLLEEFGSVENLIANSAQISNAKLREKVENNAQLAMMSKRLATIITNVPISLDFNDLRYKEPDYAKLINIYVKLEFNSFLKKLRSSEAAKALASTEQTASLVTDGGGTDGFDMSALSFCTAETPEEILRAIDADNEGEIYLKVFSDGNHKAVPFIEGISLLIGDKAYYLRGDNREKIKEIAQKLSEKQIKLCGHNLKEDYYPLLSNFSFDVRGRAFNTCYDTAIAEYVIDPSKSNYDIKTLAFEYLRREIESETDFMAAHGQISMFGDATDAYAEYGMVFLGTCKSIRYKQAEQLDAPLLQVAERLEFPLIEVMAAMEAEGFRLDKAALEETGKGIKQRIDELTAEIYKEAGESFNINSPQQLGAILFEKLELPAGKKTKKGYSTSAEVLEKLAGYHPIIPLILEYRTLTKLNGTYIDGLAPLAAEDGKIHAHFQQTVTATGRISCTEPNLQNIPIKQELGRIIRRAFVPDSGDNILLGADYSQIELRVLAALSGEQQLIDAFNNDEDIHRLTASRVFKVPFDEVTTLQRSNAKAVNFGVIYGMSGFGLSTELNISRKEAEAYIEDYFAQYTRVKAFMDEQVRCCRENGFVTTLMNRRRIINEINAGNYMVRSFGERLAMNSPIQGSAADIIKLAMISVYTALRERAMASKLILQVHDELILDAPRSESEAAALLLKECMENAVQLSVKLTAEPESGNNWYELK